VICGDTTAQIAARLLGCELAIESPPAEGWDEIPPTARLEGVHLITEGRITMSKTSEWLARARDISDLPRRENGATRLARALLGADCIHFIVGLASTNDDVDVVRGSPSDLSPRRATVGKLVNNLKGRGKLASVEYL
jgi:hypothetical protein